MEQIAEFSPGCLDGSGLGVPHPVLELGEELLDRVQVRAVGRQEEQVRAGLTDGAASSLSFMAAEIVEDDDVALGERGGEHLLGIERKELTVDGAVDDERRVDPVDPERADEGQRLPGAVGRAGRKTLSP